MREREREREREKEKGKCDFESCQLVDFYCSIVCTLNERKLFIVVAGLILWHINPYRLFNAKSFYAYILNIYNLVCLGFMQINHCRLFNAKSSLYI